MTFLGTTSEYDEYRRWQQTRRYRVELAALLIANRHGATGLPGRPVPSGDDYRVAGQIIRALDGCT